jgi:hypothetical protein
MEGVVSDDDDDGNTLVCAVTADSFYPPYYASNSDDDRMSDLDRLDAILASAMSAVPDESAPSADSDTAAAARPGPSSSPRGGGKPTALSAVPHRSLSQSIAETTTTASAEIARIAHTGQDHILITTTTSKTLQLHLGQQFTKTFTPRTTQKQS